MTQIDVTTLTDEQAERLEAVLTRWVNKFDDVYCTAPSGVLVWMPSAWAETLAANLRGVCMDPEDHRVAIIHAADAWQEAREGAHDCRRLLVDTIDYAIGMRAISEREAAQLVGISRDTVRRWRRTA